MRLLISIGYDQILLPQNAPLDILLSWLEQAVPVERYYPMDNKIKTTIGKIEFQLVSNDIEVIKANE